MIVEKNAAMMTRARVDLAVFGVALRPVDVPAEAGLDADGFGDDQRQKGRAQAHEEADEDVRHGRGNRDAEDQVERGRRPACGRRRGTRRGCWRCRRR